MKARPESADGTGWLARQKRATVCVSSCRPTAFYWWCSCATAPINGANFKFGTYLVSLLTFGSFLAILGLGQGAVITAGGLDLSVPWAITFPAIVVTTYANGSDAAATWAIPLALCIGAAIGLFNGVLVAGLRHFADHRHACDRQHA